MFELKRLPLKIRRQVKVLAEGSFADRRDNILAFGKPGSGKTQLLCGICHEFGKAGKKGLLWYVRLNDARTVESQGETDA